jgi:hypothetical protein
MDLQAIARRWSASMPATKACLAARRFATTGAMHSAMHRAEVSAFATLECLPLILGRLETDPDNTDLTRHRDDITALRFGALDLPIRPMRLERVAG